jgi:septum formation protein
MRLVLASGSPRRRALLDGLGLVFEVMVPEVDESVRGAEQPLVYVERVARMKAAAVADLLAVDPGDVDPGAVDPGDVDPGDDDPGDDASHSLVVVAADTTVDLGGEILGKPADSAEARRMLCALSGRSHQVHTAVVVLHRSRIEVQVVSTEVVFAALDRKIIEWYVGTNEPFDKAGGYAIQGRGAALVSQVHGSVTNVVGLPLAELRTMLSTIGV